VELVYLWVDKYKNIKNQGFNFSPRFECEFFPEYEKDADGKKKLKDNCKLEIKPKEHVSIFPDNINVTAIVGENGSGKSSILVEILNQAKNNINSFFCFYDNDKKEIISNIKVNQKSKISNVLKISDNNDSVKNFLNASFLYHYKNDTDLPILDNKHAIYNEEGSIFTEPNKNNNRLDIKIEEEKTLKKIIHLVHDDFYKKMNTSEFFVPRTVDLKVDEKRVVEAIKIIDEKRENKILPNYTNIKNTLTKKESLLLQNIFYFHSLFNGYGGASLNNNNLAKFNCDVVLADDINKVKDEISRFHKQIIKQSYHEQIKSQLKELIDSNIEINEKTMQLKELQKSFNLFKNIDALLDLLQKNKDETSYTEWILINKLKNDEKVELLQNLPRFLKIDFWAPHKGYYYNLSSGEKIFLELLYSVREIVSLRTKNKLSKNIFILLDEIENSLHPQWQKELIFGLISFIKTYNNNIHIIVATHSPYVLSDLPKENVIFLKDGKQDNPDIKQTFGANIHTLLSHGFFMKDGLMGEFAKEKINDAIKYLNKKSLSKKEIDYCENIISIIGEPILKNQLQRMLNSKRLSKVDKIDKLEEELELIKHRIEMIRKNQ